jgi:hypothetical protein
MLSRMATGTAFVQRPARFFISGSPEGQVLSVATALPNHSPSVSARFLDLSRTEEVAVRTGRQAGVHIAVAG